jgi:putative spermidine/putrescine transport system substrate-binding protein
LEEDTLSTSNRRAPARLGRRATRFTAVAAAGVLGASAVAACGSSSNSSSASKAASSTSAKSVSWASATSAQAGGGQTALIAAAKKEGHLNVIALPANWANYGTEMKQFTAMYGIKISDAIPAGSSAQEIQAIETGRGSSTAPDVVDVGESFAVADSKLFAPYKVQTWNDIPAGSKDSNGNWYNDYGGYISFGCNLSVVASCPSTWAGLEGSTFHHAVALNGVPGQAGAATGAVFASAINNGGTLDNAKPGLTFFNKLKSLGNFNATDCDSASLITAGQCPIIVNWDFLNVAGVWGLPSTAKWKVVVPTGTPLGEYYAQAISTTAPDPAAARLWEEFLYSTQGQNNFLKGFARPVELNAMVKAGTVDKAAYSTLPAVPGTPVLPTPAQTTNASKLIAAGWSS